MRRRSCPPLPENIQCLSESFAITRSIAPRVPKALPQAMQWNGSSSFRRGAAPPRPSKSSCGTRRDRVFRTGRGAEPALHAKALGEGEHRLVGIVGERVGRAGADAGEAERAGLGLEGEPAEGRAGRQRHDADRRGRRRVQFAEARVAARSRLPPTGRKLGRRRRRRAGADRVERRAQRIGIVRLDQRPQRPAP